MSVQKPEFWVRDWSLARVLKNLPLALSKAKYLGQYMQDFKGLTSLLRDYAAGRYRNVSAATIGLVTAAVAYVILPVDMVPDFLPVLGFGDDIAFLSAILYKVHGEIEAYNEWKKNS